MKNIKKREKIKFCKGKINFRHNLLKLFVFISFNNIITVKQTQFLIFNKKLIVCIV